MNCTFPSIFRVKPWCLHPLSCCQLAFTGGPMHLRHPNSVAHVRLLVRAPWKRYVAAWSILASRDLDHSSIRSYPVNHVVNIGKSKNSYHPRSGFYYCVCHMFICSATVKVIPMTHLFVHGRQQLRYIKDSQRHHNMNCLVIGLRYFRTH